MEIGSAGWLGGWLVLIIRVLLSAGPRIIVGKTRDRLELSLAQAVESPEITNQYSAENSISFKSSCEEKLNSMKPGGGGFQVYSYGNLTDRTLG